jgi:hypothetical protein
MKKYRANETVKFHRCEELWRLEKEGIPLTAYGVREVAAAVGTAIHAGCAAFHDVLRKNLHLVGIEDFVAIGMESLLPALDTLSQLPPATVKAMELFADAKRRTKRAIEEYVQMNPMRGVVILDIERTLNEYGGTTLDVGFRQANGRLAIGDIKTRAFSTPYYKQKFIDEFSQSWQMKHYVKGYANLYEEPVNDFWLILVDLRLTRPDIEVYEYQFDDDELELWEQDASYTWARMEEVETGMRPALRAAEHYDRYGRCEMYNICFSKSRKGGVRV